MQEGRPWHQYKERMTKALQNYGLSLKFSWTPKQIRSLTEEEKMEYICILAGNGMSEVKTDG